MQTTYIFGHRNPDTDSICSSIALAYLKNSLGHKTVARSIGHLNNETKFVLNYFHISAPQYLNDVRVRIKNLKYDKKGMINTNGSIYDAMQLMQEQNISGISIIDDNKKLVGFTSLKDLAKYLINDDKMIINTCLDNLLKVLKAEIVTKYTDLIMGNILVAGLQSSTFHDEIKLTNEDILIVGDRYKVIDYALDSGVKLIILAKDSILDKTLIKKAQDNEVTIIRSSFDSFQIANKVALSNYISSVLSTSSPTTVYDDDYYTDFLNLRSRVNYTNYPVINHKNECLGIISMSWPNHYEKQKIILVDHNNIDQSVVGIEEADIVEIIDHHNLGSLGTIRPINFRCKPVGCTATIIYECFMENKVLIPKNIAGLLASAIISDTLLLTSPTTTDEDREALKKLAVIANINVQEYGYQMLKASSSVKHLTINQQIYQDYKSYTVGKMQMGVGQLITMDFDEIKPHINEYVEKLEEMRMGNAGVYVLFITDFIKNGSYVIYNEASQSILKEAFNLVDVYQGVFLDGMVSRKKQMIPAIMNILE